VNHLSFTIGTGKTVALVGESGCRKSTTLQLLQKFYDAERGKILVDGFDLNELSGTFMRSEIAIGPQQAVLFSMSVKESNQF
jgi:ABC-type multidrug transport system fused ATPase/permease subunit